MAYQESTKDVLISQSAAYYPNKQLQLFGICWRVSQNTLVDTRLELAEQIDNLNRQALVPWMPSNAQYYGTRVGFVLGGNYNKPVATIVNVNGGGSGISAPTQLRPMVGWRTDFIGRSRRGRSYLFTPDSTAITGYGIMNGPNYTAYKGWASSIIQGIDTTSNHWIPVIQQRPKKDFPQPGPPWDISGFKMLQQFATQRPSGAFGRANELPW